MIEYCIENLQQIKVLLEGLSDENFQKRTDTLFSSTIGQHIRHILEFYICLLGGTESGIINYDNREREKKLECATSFSIVTISDVISKLKAIPADKPLKVEANFNNETGNISVLKSSLNRELAYCLEHSVHHQALIKTALKEHHCLELIDKNFGVAASTIRNRNLCVQ